MAVLGRKATPHVFYLCDVSQSPKAGSIWRLSKKLQLFPRKWARHRHPLLVCGQSSQWAAEQWKRNAALHIYLCCSCCTPDTPMHSTARGSVHSCVCGNYRALGRLPVFCASRRSTGLQCVHSARRPAVGSRRAEGSGVHRLSAVGSGLNLRGESGNEGWRRQHNHTTTSCHQVARGWQQLGEKEEV